MVKIYCSKSDQFEINAKTVNFQVWPAEWGLRAMTIWLKLNGVTVPSLHIKRKMGIKVQPLRNSCISKKEDKIDLEIAGQGHWRFADFDGLLYYKFRQKIMLLCSVIMDQLQKELNSESLTLKLKGQSHWRFGWKYRRTYFVNMKST